MKILVTLILLSLSTNSFTQEVSKEKAYKELLELSSKMIESMNSDQWTDYNVHDPGVTVMEMLCYALTDLGERREDYKMSNLICEKIEKLKLIKQR